MSEFQVRFPAWILVCTESLTIDRATRTAKLVEPVKFPSVEWGECIALPVFTDKVAAQRYARENPVPVTPLVLQTREEFLDFLERRRPKSATHVVFDPTDGHGTAVAVADAIAALRG
jgi:hypothetical protein